MPRNVVKADEVYKEIKKRIVYGKLKPGQIIMIGELADEFQVSRTPIRDGLNALKHEGLIEVLPRKGYFVTNVDVKMLENLFQMRLILEGAAAELAAKFATTAQVRKLAELAGSTVPSTVSTEETNVVFMKMNFDFHSAVAEASGNQYLHKSVADVLNMLQRALYRDLLTGDVTQMQRDHLELTELIKTGNSNRARQVMISHVEATKRRLLDTFQGGGQ